MLKFVFLNWFVVRWFSLFSLNCVCDIIVIDENYMLLILVELFLKNKFQAPI